MRKRLFYTILLSILIKAYSIYHFEYFKRNQMLLPHVSDFKLLAEKLPFDDGAVPENQLTIWEVYGQIANSCFVNHI